MTFIRNVWYVAAWTSEMEENKPLGRTIIDEPVVIWRDSSGKYIAMEDRCPHRHAALSLGRIEGDTIKCMYHGLKFSPSGECVEVPGSDIVPPNCSTKTFPVVEKYDWIWIWMGDPELADETTIPRAFGLDNDNYTMTEGSMNYEAHYELINDNLADLNHVDFVHEQTLGALSNKVFSNDFFKVEPIEGGLYFTRWVLTPIDDNSPKQYDLWITYRYMLPGLFLQEQYVYPPGTAKKLDFKAPPEGFDVPTLVETVDQQAVTPISETETRYLYAIGHNKKKAPPKGSPEDEKMLASIANAAFAEDRAMIESQQKIWNRTPQDKKKSFLPNDKAPSMFRKLVAKCIEEESARS